MHCLQICNGCNIWNPTSVCKWFAIHRNKHYVYLGFSRIIIHVQIFLYLVVIADMDIRAVDPAALVDIRDVKVNTALPKRERILDFIRQIGNPYCYRHGKYVVRVSFADTDISLEDRLEAYIRTKG